MAVFTSFSDLLPDPNNKINSAGASDSSGTAGPGFAKIKFASNNQTQISRTISGRGVAASPSYHTWAFDITYNQMTRDDFDTVGAFLESRRGRLYPFYVILPQHASPKDSIFYNYIIGTPIAHTINTVSSVPAGISKIDILGKVVGGTNDPILGNPSPGDFFTINDPNDTNHKKAYKVIRVETPTTYQTAVTSGKLRVHIHPPLARSVSSGAELVFINPKFRVIQKGDTLEYDLDTDNLYQFSLSLEEIQP